jgi:hypothetical protein
LPAICLSENNSAVTSIVNDHGVNSVYVRQLKALAQAGDFVLGFVTGATTAVQEAIDQAQQSGLETVALELPRESGPALLDHLADAEEWSATETFLTAAHLLCEEAESELQRLQPDRFPIAPKKVGTLPDLRGVPL